MSEPHCCPTCGHPAPVFHVFTDAQLEALVDRIAEHMKPPRPASVSLKDAAQLMGIKVDMLRRRVQAQLVRKLPDAGPIRIPMEEVDRLNGIRQNSRSRGTPG